MLEYLDPPNLPNECYRLYLENAVSFNVNNRSIGIMTPDLLKKFYMEECPLLAPKYLDIFKEICLSKLERAIGKEIVVISPREGNDKGGWDKIHDKTIYGLLEDRPAKPETLYFVLQKVKKEWKLFELFQERDIRTYIQIVSETHFFRKVSMCVWRPDPECCIMKVIADVLDLPLSPNHVHDTYCSSLRKFIFARDKGLIVRELGAEFVLASHIRCAPVLRRRRKIPRNNLFALHAIYELRDGNSIGIDKMNVVCVTNTLRFYKLKEEYAKIVRRPPPQRRRHLQKEAFPAPADKVMSGGASAAAAATSHKNYSCPCEGCQTSSKFATNMSASGPQVPFRCDLSTYDLFKCLGKFTPRVEEDLHKLSAFSIASFDVESIATRVHDAVGNEDLHINPASLSDRPHPRQLHAVHEPVRIGFVDHLRMDTEEDGLIFRLDPARPNGLEADFIEAIFEHRDAAMTLKYGICHKYFEYIDTYKKAHFRFFSERGWLPPDYCQRWQHFKHVEAKSEEAEEIEEEALQELARDLEDDDDMASTSSDEDENDLEREEREAAREGVERAKLKAEALREMEIEKAWQFSLWGILEKRLHYLCQCYQVYGLNAESFDLVILMTRLVTYAKESGRRDVTLSREGSKIRHMKIESIKICEIKRLLGPGTSLASLGEACNLPQHKAIFPFSQFTTLEFLDLPKLPSDAKDWINDLNPDKSPSQSEVDQVLAFYDQQGFSQVSQYLDYYLNLDIVILQKAIIKMLQVYYKVLGLSFVDSRKNTVSSFASAGAQTFLARRCRPALFFPNHQRLYNILKGSLRGGKTLSVTVL